MTSPRTGGGSIGCSSRYIPASNHGTRPTGRSPEMAHPFELVHNIEVDATPEDVWEAIATGQATVTAWEPPTRFASRTPEGADGAFHAFEYLVEGREKGSTVVRWVHSGFLGENWEAEYEGLSEGDPMYFDKLRVYLTYFR